jgi:hypothetical protein
VVRQTEIGKGTTIEITLPIEFDANTHAEQIP